jgi:hypothetical protein
VFFKNEQHMKDFTAITADAAAVTREEALHELVREIKMRIGTASNPDAGVYTKKAKYLDKNAPDVKKMEKQAAALMVVKLMIADMDEKEFNRRRTLCCQPTLY